MLTTRSMSSLRFVIFASLASVTTTANAQVVVVRHRRHRGSIIAGCVVGGLFFLAILVACCMLARGRRSRTPGRSNIEDPNTPNPNTGTTGGGTRIIAVRSRPMFWGRRRGLFGGPRIVAVSSWGGAPTPREQPPAAVSTPPKENVEFAASPGTTPPPPYGGGKLQEDSPKKETKAEKGESYIMSPIPNQPDKAHIEEGSDFIEGFKS